MKQIIDSSTNKPFNNKIIVQQNQDTGQKLQNQIVIHQSDDEEQIIIKNIDSGSYQILNMEEVDTIAESKPSVETRLSLWNSYFDQVSRIDSKLLKLILNNNFKQLKKILIQEPIELNAFRYIDGWTLLHHAVIKGSQETIKILIQHKIDVNIPSNQMKRTPLHEAVLANKPTIVKLLIQNLANPNLQDIDGNSPTHYAVQMSYFQIFQLLSTSQIPINFALKNYQQMTIIDCIRDQHILKKAKQQIRSNTGQNQNQFFFSKNKRFFQLQDGKVINRPSKTDIVAKFITLNQNSNMNLKNSILNEKQLAQMKESTGSTSSSERKKQNFGLSKKPSHWIQKKGKLIATQSLSLMKQSIIEPNQEGMTNFQQSLQNYEILRIIGSGGFADVFLGRRKKTSKFFAIKRISKAKIIENNLKRYVYSQRNIMIKCNHPFIVSANSMFQDQCYLYIVMEYCECGDLLKAISNKGVFNQKQAKIYAAQVGLALEYLHSKKILFRDLKTANVLISKDGYVKVSDFGLAKESTVSFTFLGSVHYLAPEMVVDTQMKQHTKSIDWYLFGILIYELLTGRPPFYSQKQQLVFKKIKEQKPIFPQHLSKQCKDVLLKLLQKDPKKRLGTKNDFEEIRSHKWFQEIDFQSILRKSLVLNKFDPIIKQSDFWKKVSIDNYVATEKYANFSSWNFVKKD